MQISQSLLVLSGWAGFQSSNLSDVAVTESSLFFQDLTFYRLRFILFSQYKFYSVTFNLILWFFSTTFFFYFANFPFSIIPQVVLILRCLRNITRPTTRTSMTTPRLVPMYSIFPGTEGHDVLLVSPTISYQHHPQRCWPLEGGAISSFASLVKDSGRLLRRALRCVSWRKKNDSYGSVVLRVYKKKMSDWSRHVVGQTHPLWH